MKKYKITKLLSLFLALLVVIGTIPPVTVNAANNMQSNPTGGSNTGGTLPNYVSSETMWKVHIYIGKKDTTNNETKLTGGDWYKIGKKDILICNEDITWTNYLFCDDNKVEYLNSSTDYTKVNHTFKTSSNFICYEDTGAPEVPLSGNSSTASTVKKYFGNAGMLQTFLKYLAYSEGYAGNSSGVKEMLNEVVYNPKNKAKISNPKYVIDGKSHALSTWEGKKDASGNTITAYPNADLTQSFEYLVVYEPIVITRWPGGYGINHSGKTYNRAGFTATDFIVLQDDGLTITNLSNMYYYTGSSAFLEKSWVGYEKSTASEYYKGMPKSTVYKKGGWGMRNAGNLNNALKDYAVDVSVSPSTVKTGGEVTATFKVTNALGDKASIPTKIYARIHKSGSDYYWYDLSKLTKITKTNYTAVGTWSEVKGKLTDTEYSINKGKNKTITKTVTIDNSIAEGTTIQFASFINLKGYTYEYNPGIRTYDSDYGKTYGNNYDLKSVTVSDAVEINPQIVVQLKDNTDGLESVEGKRFGVWAWVLRTREKALRALFFYPENRNVTQLTGIAVLSETIAYQFGNDNKSTVLTSYAVLFTP